MLHVLYNYVDLPLGRFTLQYIPNYGENMNIQENFHKNCSNCTNEISTSNFDIWKINEHFYKTKKGQIQIERKTLVEVKHASYIP